MNEYVNIPSLNLSDLEKVGENQYKKQDIPTGNKFLGSEVYKGILWWTIPYTTDSITSIPFTDKGMYLLQLNGISSCGAVIQPLTASFVQRETQCGPTGFSTCPNDSGNIRIYMPKLSYPNNQGGITELSVSIYAEFYYTKGWPS